MRNSAPQWSGASVSYVTILPSIERNGSDEGWSPDLLFSHQLKRFKRKRRTMTYLENSTYRHRTNRDGTFDSICPRCYRTIASADKEQHLFMAERIHECDPLRLDELAPGTRPQSLPTVAQANDSPSEKV